MDTLSDFEIKVISKIHDDIYSHVRENFVDVFLCGGSNKIHNRDKIRIEFEKNKKFRIMYPEDLFMDILNRDKNADLLTLEKFLADNCDIICIVCESVGSFVEFGAFINNDRTEKKVIALINQNHKNDKSFIMLGPIRKLLKAGKYNVAFYDSSKLEKLIEKLIKYSILKKLENTKKLSSNREINSLLGLYRFIPLLLFFFNEMESNYLVSIIKCLFKSKGYSEKHFDSLFRASLKLLFKEKAIKKSDTSYHLTKRGYDSVRTIMNNLKISDKSFLYDSIRFSIIKQKYG